MFKFDKLEFHMAVNIIFVVFVLINIIINKALLYYIVIGIEKSNIDINNRDEIMKYTESTILYKIKLELTKINKSLTISYYVNFVMYIYFLIKY